MSLYSDPQQEVIYHILELLPTVEEALRHMVGQLNEERLEESALLFRDTAQAFASIAGSMEKNLTWLLEEHEDSVIPSTARIRAAIGAVIHGYEIKDLSYMQFILQNQLLPAFGEWRRNLEEVLQAQILM